MILEIKFVTSISQFNLILDFIVRNSMLITP